MLFVVVIIIIMTLWMENLFQGSVPSRPSIRNNSFSVSDPILSFCSALELVARD